MNNKVIILTGEKQTGKTTLLQQFCNQQNNIAGILTPVVNGKRMFYDIAGKEFFAMEASADEKSLAIGKYLFSAAAFVKANTVLLEVSKSTGLEFLILDEIGPLEIKQQKGLYECFKEILLSNFAYTLIVVIRQGLIEDAIKHFNLNDVVVLSIAKMKKYLRIVL